MVALSLTSGLARSLALRTYRLSGAVRAVHWLHRNHAGIAMYHDPTPETLDRHLEYFGKHFNFTTLDVIVDGIVRRDWSRVPRRAMAVTIDDGHAGNHALLPVFQKHHLRPTIFVCTRIVGTSRRFWFNESGIESQVLKRLSNRDRLQGMLEQTGHRPEREYDDSTPQALSLEQIAEMSQWVDFEPHTLFHPILTRCKDEEAWREVVDSRQDLEKVVARSCRHFAYPDGAHDDRVVDIVRRAGYESARTTLVGWNSPGTDPFRLRLLVTPDTVDVDTLAMNVTGVSVRVRSWLSRLRALRTHA